MVEKSRIFIFTHTYYHLKQYKPSTLLSTHKLVVSLIFAITFLFSVTPSLFAQSSGDVGYRGLYFADSGVSAPSGMKPQSKLWFNDGFWWGALYERVSN